MMKATLKKILDLLFPYNYVCNMCNSEAYEPQNGICENCSRKLKRNTEPNSVKISQTDGYSWAFLFDKSTQGCIHRLKYFNCRYLGEFLAQFILLEEEWQIDFIIPVPLHKKRLKKRGYNQAELIANALGKRLSIEVVADALIRVKDTKTQTTRSKSERAEALEHAFSVIKDVENKNILLIDDVCTTGATLTSCAVALKKAKAAHVYAATACYTPKK